MIAIQKVLMIFIGIMGLIVGSAHAQTVSTAKSPCTRLPRAPANVAAYLAQMSTAKASHIPFALPDADTVKQYTEWRTKLRDSDFPALCKYQADNAALPPSSHHRVVFFGDSITELWRLNAPDLFTNDFINRGISGQTTEQMLLRFRADVIELKPAAVHIIAGTNDIAENTGPTSLPWVEANIQTMVEIAQAHGIKVILGAIPPAARFVWRPGLMPAATIIAYNSWLRDYARRQQLLFVDYHTPLDDGNGGFAAALSADGVHPNAAGYQLMTRQTRLALTESRETK